jgi:hypothetical protein
MLQLQAVNASSNLEAGLGLLNSVAACANADLPLFTSSLVSPAWHSRPVLALPGPSPCINASRTTPAALHAPSPPLCPLPA